MKKLFTVFLVFGLLITFCGCSSSQYDEKIAGLEKEISELKTEIEELKKLHQETEDSRGFSLEDFTSGQWAYAVYDGSNMVADESRGTALFAEKIQVNTEINRIIRVDSDTVYFENTAMQVIFAVKYVRQGNLFIPCSAIESPVLILVK